MTESLCNGPFRGETGEEVAKRGGTSLPVIEHTMNHDSWEMSRVLRPSVFEAPAQGVVYTGPASHIWFGNSADPGNYDTPTNWVLASGIAAAAVPGAADCPRPTEWARVYEELRSTEIASKNVKERPPVPLILDGWVFSSFPAEARTLAGDPRMGQCP